ncbi:hypothetical protein TSUD_366770 [Trifolium subterraneum]|uniref:Uncharacterized protein n=1 Tax=Trifolium subterraneum TaxID=3900 RepID=A0A2Z6LLR2_TRISU|nr:hypothetical protein TSUD_366770 [Trifolium subterraneum]
MTVVIIYAVRLQVLPNIVHGRYQWQFLASPPWPILADIAVFSAIGQNMTAPHSSRYGRILALHHRQHWRLQKKFGTSAGSEFVED